MECALALAQRVVNRFIRGHPAAAHLADDLVGEACLAIVRASKTNNEERYLRAAAVNAVREAADDGLVPRRSRKRGHEGPRAAPGADLDALADYGNRMAELREAILAACADDVDRRIVELREEGYTDAEISAHLGISTSTVAVRRKRIEERYLRGIEES